MLSKQLNYIAVGSAFSMHKITQTQFLGYITQLYVESTESERLLQKSSLSG